MTAARIHSLPRWGRAGVGARGGRSAAPLSRAAAPIPTFPQWGKEPNP
ncbi:Uncharacterised protein [Xylophilus ampelinus]|nr:Uncharacterised protein [Xylophilus ampelinus]